MDQVWIRQVVGGVLEKRKLAGEGPVSVLDVQQLAGIGPGDASYGLDLLAEEGTVLREDAPGGPIYRMKRDDELPAGETEPPAAFPSDLAAAVAAPAAVEPSAAGAMPALLQQLAPLLAAANGGQAPGEPRELRLTSAVAQAIDSDTLGAMILAGVIEAAEARAEFRLVVVP